MPRKKFKAGTPEMRVYRKARQVIRALDAMDEISFTEYWERTRFSRVQERGKKQNYLFEGLEMEDDE